MLPKSELPTEYVTPYWWCPSKATLAAIMHVEQSVRRAEMRIMYKVLGGRLPFGFMSELQVSLAQTESVDPNEELHFAPEAAVVDRLSGSVLCAGYKCGNGSVREWVIVSRKRTRNEGKDGEASGHLTDSIRVMGWVELSSSSTKGATDWRLFKRIMQKIEDMEQSAPGLCLQKMVLYVNADGKPATALKIPRDMRQLQVLLFTFSGGNKEDVDVDIVIPSTFDTPLTKSQQHLPLEGGRNRVEAFFAKKADDNLINVHAEGQLMTRIVMDPGCGWDCIMNPQPTVKDLYSSIAMAGQRNVRVLHLAGHGRKDCGFIWNVDDAATASQELDIDAIAFAIGAVVGQQGPLECALLNACTTEKMGQMLRQRGLPCVLCWKTPVHDETAKELCEYFYRALVEDVSGSRNYRRAFVTATNGMRRRAYTNGLAHRSLDADDQNNCQNLMRSSSTRNASLKMKLEHEISASGQEGCGSSQGKVEPWHEEDVVLFLSSDGDIDPIYLWRERCVAPVLPASLDTALKAMFDQSGLGAICADVCFELGVSCVKDLALVTEQDLKELPKHITDNLKAVHKRKLSAMIASRSCSAQGAPGHRCRIFLGYRVSKDADLVERIYDKLKAEGMNVWWDRRSLEPGKQWEQGFADGLCSSDIFVPFLSKAALENFADLTAEKMCDNVLLEHQLALELLHRGNLRAIFPILVGEPRLDAEYGEMYGDFFKGGVPTCMHERVLKVEYKLKEHLKRLGKGEPQLLEETRTVHATLDAIKGFQGVKLTGMRIDAMEKVVAEIVKLAKTVGSSFS